MKELKMPEVQVVSGGIWGVSCARSDRCRRRHS